VRVILPLYRAIDAGVREKLEHVLYFYINLGWRRQYVGIEKLERDGVVYYFVDNEQYFGRDYIYGSGEDEGEREDDREQDRVGKADDPRLEVDGIVADDAIRADLLLAQEQIRLGAALRLDLALEVLVVPVLVEVCVGHF